MPCLYVYSRKGMRAASWGQADQHALPSSASGVVARCTRKPRHPSLRRPALRRRCPWWDSSLRSSAHPTGFGPPYIWLKLLRALCASAANCRFCFCCCFCCRVRFCCCFFCRFCLFCLLCFFFPTTYDLRPMTFRSSLHLNHLMPFQLGQDELHSAVFLRELQLLPLGHAGDALDRCIDGH